MVISVRKKKQKVFRTGKTSSSCKILLYTKEQDNTICVKCFSTCSTHDQVLSILVMSGWKKKIVFHGRKLLLKLICFVRRETKYMKCLSDVVLLCIFYMSGIYYYYCS